eukprot:CAMPEP_0116849084 /NCGR_PEP_ID=MMETSP0418-20121206/15372_1 /TAXON_ID=1158023 /ORGANISM="Astrosyne radiata, Strain 13vi08-1A" /LENGTH=156 /DNA_ID=CAMNT_0004480759 /DNA_START=5 /DNA_END=472 /DNA_ORIENTATION=+
MSVSFSRRLFALALLLLAFVAVAERKDSDEGNKRSLRVGILSDRARVSPTSSSSIFDRLFVALYSNPSLLNFVGEASQTGPWDQCVGQSGTNCCAWIVATNADLLNKCFVILDGTPVTLDVREDRVRVWEIHWGLYYTAHDEDEKILCGFLTTDDA